MLENVPNLDQIPSEALPAEPPAIVEEENAEKIEKKGRTLKDLLRKIEEDVLRAKSSDKGAVLKKVEPKKETGEEALLRLEKAGHHFFTTGSFTEMWQTEKGFTAIRTRGSYSYQKIDKELRKKGLEWATKDDLANLDRDLPANSIIKTVEGGMEHGIVYARHPGYRIPNQSQFLNKVRMDGTPVSISSLYGNTILLTRKHVV